MPGMETAVPRSRETPRRAKPLGLAALLVIVALLSPGPQRPLLIGLTLLLILVGLAIGI